MGDVRLDKWLWAARIFKSRTLAAAACAGGKVDLNDQAAKPSRAVRPGDLLRVTLPRGKKLVRVAALSERRGGGAQAALLYEDLTPPPSPEEIEARRLERIYRAAVTPPRAPDKRQRRELRRLRGRDD